MKHRLHPRQEARLKLGNADVLIASTLVVAAAMAVVWLPEGDLLRLLVVLPTLFFAPGYLLIQALPIARTRRWSRTVHAIAAVGLSPPVVGLLALSTSLVPGGFRPTAIIGVVTFTSLTLAAVALYRRSDMREPGFKPGGRQARPPGDRAAKKHPDIAK